MRHRGLFCALFAVSGLVACKNDKPAPIAEQAPPPASASASAPLAVGEASYVIRADGKVSVGIDAPLEKFKGETKKLGGWFRVRPNKLDASTGTITASLLEFKTMTFDDKDKNESQTEHALNWFEVGDDVKAKRPKDFDNYKEVLFQIDAIESVTPSADLTQVPEKDGLRTVTMKAKGTLWVHSRPAPKTVLVELAFKGSPTMPSEVSFKTKEPVHVSLAAHDVKPRDTAGKFLDGTLSVIGKKLDDDAQVNVEGSATHDPGAKVAASASAMASAMVAGWQAMPPPSAAPAASLPAAVKPTTGKPGSGN